MYLQTIWPLLTTTININEKNPKGRTSLDLIPQNPLEMNQRIKEILRQVGALKAEEITESISNIHITNNFAAEKHS